MGVAPAEPGEHSTIPPRAGSGGNIDCKDLVAGATLYLPVAVPGALLYLGDGHAAQGDGEVGGTAIECGMTTEVTVTVVTDRPLGTVHAEAPAGRITFGFDADLNVATGDALDAMVVWMQQLSRPREGRGPRAGQHGRRPAGHAGGQPDLGRARAAADRVPRLSRGVRSA